MTKTSATFAEQPGAIPNYIFPLASSQFYSAANVFQFQYLMYRPLYSFGTNGQVQLNNALSLAYPPVYSNDGKSVTMTLKGWKWSDGVPITARDIQFWQNLVTANKAIWPAYVPGEYPDNVVSSTISPRNPLQITFTLSHAYGSYFFTYNELSQITPLPQHLWDKESATGSGGNLRRDAGRRTGRLQVPGLRSHGRSAPTPANPLWSVVSGPWKLKSMDTAGNVQMVPNPQYGGPVKPTLKVFRELAFTQASDELNQLKAATSVANTVVDFGYLPAEESQQIASLSSAYTVDPWSGWSINYIPINFTNPISGPILRQLYFRQAMQYLVDQRRLIATTFLGYANPTYGPVPVADPSQFADAQAQRNPYPYNPTAAESLLQANGWTVNTGRREHLRVAGHRHRRVRCGHQAGPAGVLHPRICQRRTDGDPGDEAAGVRLRRGRDPAQGHADDLRRGPRDSGALHARDGVLVGPGVLGQPVDLLAGLLPVGRPALGLHGLGDRRGLRRLKTSAGTVTRKPSRTLRPPKPAASSRRWTPMRTTWLGISRPSGSPSRTTR